MGRGAGVDLVGLLDGCSHLLFGELGGAGLYALGHDSAGGHELDPVRSGLQLLSGGLAGVIGTVGFPAAVPAVSAGHADVLAGDLHLGSADLSLLLHVPELDIVEPAAAHVADEGDAGGDQLSAVLQGVDDALHVSVVGDAGLAAHEDVGVAVEEARAHIGSL